MITHSYSLTTSGRYDIDLCCMCSIASEARPSHFSCKGLARETYMFCNIVHGGGLFID